jgi:hypothetical protein
MWLSEQLEGEGKTAAYSLDLILMMVNAARKSHDTVPLKCEPMLEALGSIVEREDRTKHALDNCAREIVLFDHARSILELVEQPRWP